MERGTRKFPIKLEGTPYPRDSSESEASPGPESSNSGAEETPLRQPTCDPLRMQPAMTWFMSLPSKIHATFLGCCISRKEYYLSHCNKRGVARKKFFELVRVDFNVEVPNCRLRRWRFVEDCIEELCRPRSDLRRPLARPRNELEANIDSWNAIVASQRRRLGRLAALDYPELQLEFIAYLSCDPELAASADEEYAPNVGAWTRTISGLSEDGRARLRPPARCTGSGCRRRPRRRSRRFHRTRRLRS